MAAWMIYLTAVGCVAGVSGVLTEAGLRRLGRPVRWAWAGAMVMTVTLPFLATGGRAVTGHVWSAIPAAGASSGADVILIGVWVTMSLILLANVRLSTWTVRRNERSWRRSRLGNHDMAISSGFGPGVIGARRPRIVLPEWVLDAAPSLRSLIVRHEAEHARAGDTGLLLGAVVLVTLMPWCLPLWWQLHRLRGAIEVDCDARVVAATNRPAEYARALVEVAGRRSRGLLPVPALGPRSGELERRIRLITAGPPAPSPLPGAGLLAGAAILVLAVASMATPTPPAVTFDRIPAATEPPASATVYLTIAPGLPDPIE